MCSHTVGEEDKQREGNMKSEAEMILFNVAQAKHQSWSHPHNFLHLKTQRVTNNNNNEKNPKIKMNEKKVNYLS